MQTPVLTLTKGEGRFLKGGGLWVFDNEIDAVTDDARDGELIAVEDYNGFPLGTGFYNSNSKIRVRMLTRNPEQEIDEDFLAGRVRAAWDYRKHVMRPEDLNCLRLIFGEADFLPGMVVDKYANILVVQCLAMGIEPYKMTILNELKQVLAEDGITIRGIYERNDAKERTKEGLERTKGYIGEPFEPQVEIIENGIRYMVDVENGQKTGFFLDQKYNRLAVSRISHGARVLDCFTHTGSFALNAAMGGAREVTAVDASDTAIAQAEWNARLNHMEDRVHFQCTDVFDLLPQLVEQGERYDIVILDPPAFTKSRSSVRNAAKGYREINMKGMKLVRDGGFLATCSCSSFMPYEMFTDVIRQAARSAHKRLRQIEYRTQAPDHPILWAADESYYLKFYIFQVCDEK